ncbi:MAG: hypothetical protein KDI01_06850, partial [Halioglobus sp.]|nr:hypothetical protein [Halioglobus sp.]
GSASGAGDRAILRYQQAALDASQPAPRLERLGWAYVAKARESRDPGYYKLAEQTALCLDSRVANSAESLLLRGHVLLNLHRFAEAEVLARRLTALRGQWVDFALLGDVLVDRGKLEEAIDAYQVVADRRPGPQAYARIARVRTLKGDQQGALQMMSLAAGSTSARVPEAAAWVHTQLAELLLQAGRLTEADSALSTALSLQADYPPALYTRGRLLLGARRAAEAVPVLVLAVEAEPQPAYRWALYEALREAGQFDAAMQQRTLLLRQSADEDRRTYALFLASTGEAPATATALRLALAELEQRQDVFTLDTVAWAMHAAGRHNEALRFSQRALTHGTRHARLFLHAGAIAARNGDGEQAAALLAAARAGQQMLLPSERTQLAEEFAALSPQIPPSISREPIPF